MRVIVTGYYTLLLSGKNNVLYTYLIVAIAVIVDGNRLFRLQVVSPTGPGCSKAD